MDWFAMSFVGHCLICAGESQAESDRACCNKGLIGERQWRESGCAVCKRSMSSTMRCCGFCM